MPRSSMTLSRRMGVRIGRRAQLRKADRFADDDVRAFAEAIVHGVPHGDDGHIGLQGEQGRRAAEFQNFSRRGKAPLREDEQQLPAPERLDRLAEKVHAEREAVDLDGAEHPQAPVQKAVALIKRLTDEAADIAEIEQIQHQKVDDRKGNIPKIYV